MTINELMSALRQFVTERNWEEFHTPKNLTMALAAEVGELLEIFQWDSGDEDLMEDPEMRAKVEGEFADVFLYLLSFANATGIDPLRVAEAKLRANERRFTHERSRELADDRFRDRILGRD